MLLRKRHGRAHAVTQANAPGDGRFPAPLFFSQ